MDDRGRSAFRRKNPETYALSKFVEEVRAGRVAAGSFLIVENLDRLSREEEGEAAEMFLSIVNRGVVIVTLSPRVAEYRKPVRLPELVAAVVEFGRAHSESAAKSERGVSVWGAKRRAATSRVVTRKLPGWIRFRGAADRKLAELDDASPKSRLELIPDRAAVIRRVFSMAKEGMGVAAIAGKLNADRVPVLGRKVFRGRTVRWNETVVYHLLTTRTVLGEYQPCRGHGADRHADGPPVMGYYPAVIGESEWFAAQAALSARRRVRRGRRGNHTNLFAGLIRDARDGGSLTYKHLSGRPASLIPVGAKQGRGSVWSSFRADVFEAALLSALKELTAEDVYRSSSGGDRTDELTARLAEVDGLIGQWRAKMDNPALVEVVAGKLAELTTRRKELTNELNAERERVAAPASAAFESVRTAADVLAADPSDETRVKVRDALRRTVESVTCLFVSGRGGGDRIAAVTIAFRDSPVLRNVMIFYRSPRGNGKKKIERGRWAVRTSRSDDGPWALCLGRTDLREEHIVPDDEGREAAIGWRDTLESMKTYSADELDRVLKAGTEIG